MSLESRLARLEAATAAVSPVEDNTEGRRPHRFAHLPLNFHLMHHHIDLLWRFQGLAQEQKELSEDPELENAMDMIVRCITDRQPCELCGVDILDDWLAQTGRRLEECGKIVA